MIGGAAAKICAIERIVYQQVQATKVTIAFVVMA
jgi:hypothetical protein